MGHAAADAYRDMRRLQHRARLNEDPTALPMQQLQVQRARGQPVLQHVERLEGHEAAQGARIARLEQALQTYAFGWAENMTQAALKAVPLGQSSGQRMLATLARTIPDAVQTARSLTDETRQAFSPMLAILSSRHETQYSRLFRS